MFGPREPRLGGPFFLHNAWMITLSSGALRCEIAPQLGGCIAGLWFDGLPVLRSTPAAQLASSRQAGSYPLVPFSNRIAQATLQWQGTQHPLVRNNGEEPHAIHGVGWQRPWEVLEANQNFAMLAFEHPPDASWPFAFDCSQTFRVTPDTLELTLSLTNQSPIDAPAGLGWHPYFTKRVRSHLSFEASGRWEMGDDKLPTRREPSSGLDVDCAFLDIDHCFDGWTGAAVLRDEALEVRIESSLTHLVVFTNDTRPSVAIEPVSHANNAMNFVSAGADPASLGVVILKPGESMSASMAIHVEKSA
jgi:aldose 1-epimerase